MTKGTIMAVDDQPANLDLLRDILSRDGFEVRLFPSGELALKSARSVPPDLILLDIMMPGMDGYEMCRRLKAMDETRDIPVIFISAKSITFDKVKAFELGGVDYVTKPFQVAEVMARVNTHLSLRRYQLESIRQNEELKNMLDRLKSTQSQLIQSEKMASIGVLAAGIAHELNNPINFISISTKGLKKKLQPITSLLQRFCTDNTNLDRSEEMIQQIADLELIPRLQAIDELTANIETGAERAVDIVQGLRSFSRMDLVEKEVTDVHRALESALIILQNQIRGTISIVREYGDIPRIKAFPGKLAQMFMNILKNGIDATLASGDRGKQKTIRVRTETATIDAVPYVSVHISDTGRGIPEEIQGKLFDPFFTTKEVGKGTGLGLAIVLGIVESHQGKIAFSSNGEGTTFSVHLPVDQGK